MALTQEQKLPITLAVQRLAAVLEEAASGALQSIEDAKRDALARIGAATPPNENEMTIPEAARYLGISVRTLHRRVQERQVAFRRDGARVFFTRVALDEYRRRETRPAL